MSEPESLVVESEETPSDPVAEEATEPEPSDCALCIGRIVLWWRADRAQRTVKAHPAIITAVYADSVVDLVAFATPMGSTDWRQGVPMGGPERANSWSWPPRVDV